MLTLTLLCDFLPLLYRLIDVLYAVLQSSSQEFRHQLIRWPHDHLQKPYLRLRHYVGLAYSSLYLVQILHIRLLRVPVLLLQSILCDELLVHALAPRPRDSRRLHDTSEIAQVQNQARKQLRVRELCRPVLEILQQAEVLRHIRRQNVRDQALAEVPKLFRREVLDYVAARVP